MTPGTDAQLPAPDGDAPRTYRARPAPSVIEVDGILAPGEWDDAQVIPLRWEVDPGENERASVETTCRIARDEENLYLGCRASDPDPERIRAYVTDRDGIDGHDRIVLLLDPFRDARRGFVFGVSALGVQSDAFFNQQGTGFMGGGGDPLRDPSWDAIWQSAGRIGDGGYSVEAAIPFRSLRFPRDEDAEAWGMLISRHWPRSSAVELRSAPLDRSDSCVLCQADRLAGLEGVSPGRNVQLSPTLTASRSDGPAEEGGGLESGPLNGEAGLDARWSPRPSLTLNLTANPDFSQVEADAAQLEVNQAFALFFPEKRPFFQEGADVFQTPIQALFTRSMADPSAGAKLTGKLGANAVGAMLVRDEVNGRIIPGREGSSSALEETPVTTGVARLRRDLGESSTLGGLAVLREGAGYHNRVAGVDGFFQPLPTVTARAQYLRSWTADRAAEPIGAAAAGIGAADSFSGDAFQGHLRYASRDWILNSDLRYRGDGFRADAGFVPQVGVRGGNASVQRRFWGERGSWFTRLTGQIGFWSNRTLDDDVLAEGIWLGGTYQGPGQLSVTYFPNIFREGFRGEVYDMVTHFFNVSARPSGTLTARLNGQLGGAVDFANARKADQVRLSPGIELRLGRRTFLDLSHTYQRLESADDGREIFTAHLSEVRAVYNFSARAFLRGVVQHRLTDRNPAVYAAEVPTRRRTVFSQLLFSYKVNPQTVFFLGYTDDRAGLSLETDRRLRIEPTGRTLFVKVGYAWRP